MKQCYPFAILVLLLVLGPGISFSQPGFLDASFGNGEKVITPVGDSSSVANAVAVTPEGNIVVGGTSYIDGQSVATLMQYNKDGTLDTSFGFAGKVVLSNEGWSFITSVAIQPDGKIIAGGAIDFYSLNGGFLVARYNSDGSIDSTFGENGIAPVAIPDNFGYISSYLEKVIVKADGKIMAGGVFYTGIFASIPLLVQYLPNGIIDSSFGTKGTITKGTITKGIYFLGGTMDRVNDLAVTADDKIIAVINESPAAVYGLTNFATYKLLPNGDNDSTFGEYGVVRTDIDSFSEDNALSTTVLPDNSFVVAGYSYKYIYYPTTKTYYSATSIALVKYHANGSLDSNFGTNGRVRTLALPDSTVYGSHILLLADGSLIVSGYTSSGKANFIIAKYRSNGTPDSSFGSNGITTTDFSGTIDFSYSSALQPDGKIVLAGSAGSSTSYNIALARYNNDIIYPVHLLSFTAIRNGSTNLLQWQTAQEINISKFEVQRSNDGKNYSSIGYVNAGNNSYSFTDTKPFNSNNYYHLKIIDKDGSSTYSPVRIINNTVALAISMYPNPVEDNLQLQMNTDKETVLQWQITSGDGRVISAGHYNVLSGTSVKTISVAFLQKGMYFITTTTKEKETVMMKFEKL